MSYAHCPDKKALGKMICFIRFDLDRVYGEPYRDLSEEARISHHSHSSLTSCLPQMGFHSPF